MSIITNHFTGHYSTKSVLESDLCKLLICPPILGKFMYSAVTMLTIGLGHPLQAMKQVAQVPGVSDVTVWEQSSFSCPS